MWEENNAKEEKSVTEKEQYREGRKDIHPLLTFYGILSNFMDQVVGDCLKLICKNHRYIVNFVQIIPLLVHL